VAQEPLGEICPGGKKNPLYFYLEGLMAGERIDGPLPLVI